MKEHSISKPTIDKAWQQMQQTLDAEMPQKKRRKPFFWFFLLAGLALGATALIWWPNGSNQSIFKQNEPLKAVPKQKQEQAKAVVSSKNELVFIEGHAGKSKSSTPTTNNSQTQTGADGPTPSAIISASEKPASIPVQTPVLAPEALAQWAKIPPFALLAAPALATPIISGIQTEPPLPPITLIQPQHSQHWQAGIYALGGLYPGQMDATWEAGTFVDWKPLQQFGVRMGAGVNVFNPSGKERPLAATSASILTDTLGYNAVDASFEVAQVLSADASSVVYMPISRQYSLSLPFQLYWQPIPSLRLYGGIGINYVFSVKTSNQILATNPSRVVSDFSQSEANRLASQSQRTWSQQGMLGLSYSLNKHWELGLNYKARFPSLGNNKQDYLYNYTNSGLNSADAEAADANGSSSNPQVQLQLNYRF